MLYLGNGSTDFFFLSDGVGEDSYYSLIYHFNHSGLYYKNNIIIINRTSLIVKRVISDQCMSTLTDGNAGFVGLPLCEFVHRRVR